MRLTSSTGSSAPRSPRATMAPSTASRMSSRLPTLSALSILARTPMEAPVHAASSTLCPVNAQVTLLLRVCAMKGLLSQDLIVFTASCI